MTELTRRWTVKLIVDGMTNNVSVLGKTKRDAIVNARATVQRLLIPDIAELISVTEQHTIIPQ